MRILTDKHMEEGMDLIEMGVVELMIRKTLAFFYQSE